MDPNFVKAAARVHAAQADIFASVAPFMPIEQCVMALVRVCLECALVELENGLSAPDVEFLQCAILASSPPITAHGLTDFAICEFQASFAEILGQLRPSGGRT